MGAYHNTSHTQCQGTQISTVEETSFATFHSQPPAYDICCHNTEDTPNRFTRDQSTQRNINPPQLSTFNDTNTTSSDDPLPPPYSPYYKTEVIRIPSYPPPDYATVVSATI